ncbi:MAG TPA: DUF5615 family PIN-like protein [Gemmataceae bacterium]|jgi:predicted nuclease of predicted toxin-antitoxin system|nr:DUF5615 family PIN-like protein [Gemmataceae bacterium]
MIIWLDAQRPPALVAWMTTTFKVDARAVRDLGLRNAKDIQIFHAARDANAVVMTKDSDFVELVNRLGSPPQIVWVTCGNTTNVRLRALLTSVFPRAAELLRQGEQLVEVGDLS